MSWVSLGEALENAVAKALESGETGVGAPSQPKRTASAKPAAKYTGQRPTKGEIVEKGTATPGRNTRTPLTASRWEYTATKAGAPLSEAVYCHLVVIEGGRSPEGRDREAPAYRSSTRGDASKLKLVVG